jgi:hypothetical protein
MSASSEVFSLRIDLSVTSSSCRAAGGSVEAIAQSLAVSSSHRTCALGGFDAGVVDPVTGEVSAVVDVLASPSWVELRQVRKGARELCVSFCELSCPRVLGA